MSVHRRTIVALFVFLGLIWGSSFVGIEILVHRFPPWFGASMRLAVAVLALFVLIQVRGRSIRMPTSAYLKVWGAGLLAVGIPFSLLFWGEQKVSGGLAGILNGTVPLWTTVFFMLAPDRKTAKRLNTSTIVGVVLGFIGLIVIFYPRIALPSGHDEIQGAVAVLGMALSYATANLINRKILTQTKNLKIEVATFHQHLSSFIYLTALSLAFESSPSWNYFWETPAGWFSVLYLGVVSSALAFIIYFYLLREIGAVQTGAVTYLIPIVALALDFLIQGHAPATSSVVGIACILVGLFFIRSAKPA